MKHVYKNKYGSLELEVVSNYQDVSKIRSKDQDPSLFFSIDQAEQIALITGNRGIQLCVTQDHKQMFVIHHQSSGVAAVCRVTKIEFAPGINATKELENPHPQVYLN